MFQGGDITRGQAGDLLRQQQPAVIGQTHQNGIFEGEVANLAARAQIFHGSYPVRFFCENLWREV